METLDIVVLRAEAVQEAREDVKYAQTAQERHDARQALKRALRAAGRER